MTSDKPVKKWINRLLFAVALFVLALLVFYPVLNDDSVLFTSDDNIGEIQMTKGDLPSGFFGRVKDYPLLGVTESLTLKWTNLLIWLLPVRVFCSSIHLIDLLVASIFFAAFLRLRNIGWLGCFLGIMTAYWLGTNMTLAYAGHIGKFGVLMFCAISLFCIEKMAHNHRWYWPVLTGGALGAMLLEQQDVALFFGLFLAPYAIFAIVRVSGWKWKPLVLKLVPCLVIALMISGGAAWSIYSENSQVEGVAETKTPQQQWDFSTQWSVPMDECIDFIAPGYMGWRSHEPDGPYWGRTGQSADWKKTRQGFQNFRLEGVYLGVIPVIFCLFSVFAVFSGLAPGRQSRQDIFFWIIVLVVSLLLAFGRYFPLYKIFFQLPMISSIRNPNKFLHVFQVALAFLAASGFNALWIKVCETGANHTKIIKRFLYPLGGLAILFLGWGCVNFFMESSIATRFSQQGWGQYAAVIAGNINRAIFHGALISLLCTGFVWAVTSPRLERQWVRGFLSVLLLLVVVVDILLLSRHYIKPFDVERNVGENVVVSYLKKNLGEQRIYCMDQSGLYNQWLTIMFPFHHIPAFNIVQMPRMQPDYKRFLQTLGNSPLRLWSLAGVRYILTSSQTWNQLQQTPGFHETLSPVLGFNAMPGKDGVSVNKATSFHPAQQWILEYNKALPRFSLYGNWRVMDDKQALATMAASAFDPQQEMIIAPEYEALLPSRSTTDNAGKVEVRNYTSSRMELKVTADQAAVMLSCTHYGKGWSAYLDGISVPVLRCNYLCQGVVVPAGEHNLTLEYSSDPRPLYLELAGLMLVGVAFLFVLLQTALPRKKNIESR